mmetsp:Transcript_13598/g.25545  ORF Transcript_13598/g.25545 Transcript_13598/m.25545 type:complete len:558 (-) Transcript_13598:107-1780(-)
MQVALLQLSLFLLQLLSCCVNQLSAFVVNSRTFTAGVVTSAKSLVGTTDQTHVGKTNKFALFSQTSTRAEEKVQVANVVLEGLEKRLKKGSLTGAEATAVIEASSFLLDYIDELENVAQDHHDGVVQVQEELIYDEHQLRTAVAEMDVDAVSQMLKAGLTMDAATTNTAFWNVVDAVDHAEAEDRPLPTTVTQMLHHVFEADMQQLLLREKETFNVTCMQPDDTGIEGAARKMNYIFDDGDHKNLPLTEGRRCEDGSCCDKCSRNIFRTFASDAECDLQTFPELSSFTFNNLETVSAGTILQFVRLIERVRRTVAHEYGLPLKTILPLQAYSRKYVAGTTQKGGGGGEGDFVTLHTDEATHSGYHYSCVLYLSTQGKDFEGGDFVFNDPAPKSEDDHNNSNKKGNSNYGGDEEEFNDDEIDEDILELLKRGELPDKIVFNVGVDENDDEESYDSLEDEIRRAGRVLTPFHPSRGSAVIFSSGWENMHEVEKITSGVRYAVPCFFTTCPVPDAAYEQMHVGKPKTDEDIADDWLHLLLAHRKEEPMESVGRVKELLMK